jgi:PAS domain S-box-containing protein
MPRRRTSFPVAGLVLLATLSTGAALASPDPRLFERWRWAHFTRESGLPSDFVSSVTDVPGDGIWVVTRAGIARYDGFVWKMPRTEAGLSTQATCLVPDGSGGVVAVAGSRLLAGNRDTVRVVTVPENGTSLAWTGCARAPGGPTLLLSEGGRLYEWDGRAARPRQAERALGVVLSLHQAGAGAVWLSTETGLWSWESGQWRRRLAGTQIQLRGVFEVPGVRAIAYVENPRSQRGLWEWRLGAAAPSVIRRAVEDTVASIAIGRNGEAAVVHQNGDVMLRDNSEWAAFNGADTDGDIAEARAVGYLANNDLWIATDRGLFLHRRGSTLLQVHAFPPPDDRNNVNALAALPDGRLLLGTSKGSIEWAPGTEFVPGPVRPTADPGAVTGLAVDLHGFAWAVSGSSFTGALRRDASGTWRPARLDPAVDEAFLHRVSEDSRGALWFLSLSLDPMRLPDRSADGPGAFKVTVDPGGHAASVERWGKGRGLLSGRVYDFTEGPDGAYWFATASALSRWYDGRWTHWTVRDGLKSNRVFSVAIDRQGDAWFSHQTGMGVGRIHGNEVTYFTEADGLATDAIWEVRIDAQNRPWAAGEGGVSVFTEGAWATLGPQTGLSHTRFWPLLFLGDRVYVGSRGGGLAQIEATPKASPGPLVVAEPAAEIDRGILVRWHAFAWWGEVPPGAVPARVRLDDGPWEPWTTERQVRFSGLSSGPHTVGFQTRGPLGAINTGTPVLRFTVAPPFTRRPAFFVPVAGLALLAAGLVAVLVVRQHRHHQALHVREEQLSRTFQGSPLATAVTRLDDGRLLEVNEAMVRLAGRPREELIGRTAVATGFVSEDDQRDAIVAAVDAGRRIAPVPLKARSAQGGVLEMLAYSDVVEYAGARAVLTHLLDVTEQRRLEAQLRQAQKMESIGRLAGGVAHDFNNLLTVIVGNASLLEMDLPPGDSKLEEVEQIKIAGDRAERLTRQLLAFARRQIVEPRILDLNSIVLSTDRMLRRLIGEDIELVTLLDAEGDCVLIDPSQIEQVLMNMAVNARDAMPKGGTLTIRTQNVSVSEQDAMRASEASAGRFVRLTISDTGSGMDPQTLGRLFEPFFTTKEPGKGTGLGLATCYGIVRQAGGHILVESEVGVGTTFHVDLPPAPAEQDGGAAREHPAASAGGAERVLLVEDEVQVRRLAGAALRNRGYEVEEAGTGSEALQLFGDHGERFDILVTDVVMPHMRGTELAARVREARPTIKVLYVSGYTDTEVFMGEAGHDRAAFLGKPFTPETLARKVREVLDL